MNWNSSVVLPSSPTVEEEQSSDLQAGPSLHNRNPDGRRTSSSNKGKGLEILVNGHSKFHSHHGSNIQLDESRTIATRKTSFANGLTFSERPLSPGEIFVVEVAEHQSGWSGHMRIGLTQLSPNDKFELPLYALPDLVGLGPTWIYAITKSHNNMFDTLVHLNLAGSRDEDFEPAGVEVEPDPSTGSLGLAAIEQNMLNYSSSSFPIVVHREGSMIRTPNGLIHPSKLLPKISDGVGDPLPTDVGSRIGVMYVPTRNSLADMHFIINGFDQGPCTRDIPYRDAPIYAVVDVYGCTTKVRLIQLDEVESLQSKCRNVILKSIKESGVSGLPLPRLLKDYLLYNYLI